MAKRFTSKGRTSKTYDNKLRKLKAFYRKIFKNSKEQHKRNEAKGYKKPDSSYFFMKYPTEKSWFDKVKIKGIKHK